MKINITKKQYRALVDLIFAGNIMINGIRTHDEFIGEYEELTQYIYSFAKDFGSENLIEYNKEYDEYMPTGEFEESAIREYIDEYDDYVFWQELAGKLAQRDVHKEYNGQVDEENHEEVLRRMWEIEGEYEEEFINNGLNNLKVDKK